MKGSSKSLHSNDSALGHWPELTEAELLASRSRAQQRRGGGKVPLLCFSTWWGGFFRDPFWMTLPLDDHMVHRGDGVFEAIKFRSGKVWLLDEHLLRLEASAKSIDLILPISLGEIRNIILRAVNKVAKSDGLIRLFVSRGPGSFTVSPRDSLGSQLYLVVEDLAPASSQVRRVILGTSRVAPKPAFFARIKSCNYLPNVLMKAEALENGWDFALGVSTQGCYLESATENLLVLSQDNTLLSPPRDLVLAGTTMERVLSLVESANLAKVRRSETITLSDLRSARELWMVGTTLDICAASRFEDVNYPEPEIATKALGLVLADQR